MIVDPDMAKETSGTVAATAAEQESGGHMVVAKGIDTAQERKSEGEQGSGDGVVVRLGATNHTTYTAEEISTVLDEVMDGVIGGDVVPRTASRHRAGVHALEPHALRSVGGVGGGEEDPEKATTTSTTGTAAARFSSPLAGAVVGRDRLLTQQRCSTLNLRLV